MWCDTSINKTILIVSLKNCTQAFRFFIIIIFDELFLRFKPLSDCVSKCARAVMALYEFAVVIIMKRVMMCNACRMRLSYVFTTVRKKFIKCIRHFIKKCSTYTNKLINRLLLVYEQVYERSNCSNKTRTLNILHCIE